MIPPSLVIVRIESRKRRLRLWLPIFILWPLYILAIPVSMLVSGILAICCRQSRMLLAGYRLHQVFCSLNGTRVQVNNSNDKISVAII